MANILVYELDGKIYINLTNKCTNDCIFCLRKDKDDVKGQQLWLDNEDSTADDVAAQYEEILRLKPCNDNSEVIFCGYGEPLLKLNVLKEVAKYIKNKRNIVPELKGLIDVISVSLNGESSEEYNELSQPNFDNAYEEVKKFIKACSDNGFETIASVVDGYKGRHLNLEKCEKIATELGAKFRVREWIPNGY